MPEAEARGKAELEAGAEAEGGAEGEPLAVGGALGEALAVMGVPEAVGQAVLEAEGEAEAVATPALPLAPLVGEGCGALREAAAERVVVGAPDRLPLTDALGVAEGAPLSLGVTEVEGVAARLALPLPDSDPAALPLWLTVAQAVEEAPPREPLRV